MGLDRSAAAAWYRRNRARSRELFDLLVEDAYYSQPIALRHPIVFYEGHLPGFSFNTLVKKGLGRFSARQVVPAKARQLIEQGAKKALGDLSSVPPYDPGSPCEIEIEFTAPDRLQEYANRKGVEVTGPRTLVSSADDWWTAWSQFYF